MTKKEKTSKMDKLKKYMNPENKEHEKVQEETVQKTEETR